MRNARVLHLALFAGAALAAALIAGLRQVLAGEPAIARDVMRYVAAGLIGADLVAFRVLRARLEPLAPGGDESAWWRANLGRVVVGWVLAEGVALVGSVFYFLSGDVAMLGVVVAGLVLLGVMNPARLTGS